MRPMIEKGSNKTCAQLLSAKQGERLLPGLLKNTELTKKRTLIKKKI